MPTDLPYPPMIPLDRPGDALSRFVWRQPSRHLAAWAIEDGAPPYTATAARALLSGWAFALLWFGAYGFGLLAALVALLLAAIADEMDAPPFARAVDQALGLIVPPLWYWAWEHGLAAVGRPLEPVYAVMLLGAICGGHVGLLGIAALFRRRFGFAIERWRPVDRGVALIAASAGIDLLLLAAGLIAGRPDSGLELATLWTLVSLIFFAVRLTQADARADRGRRIIEWRGQ